MSPRAAWRLESLGFQDVYDFAAGKAAWLAAGLPIEGAARSIPCAGEHARRDVPTCRLDEPLQVVCERVRSLGWDTCVVINEGQVVLGRLGHAALAREAAVLVEEAMSEGPSTIRPDVPVETIVGRLRERNLSTVLVTTLEGELVGLLRLDDVERALEKVGA